MCTLSGQLWWGPPGCKSLREELSSIKPWLPDTSFRERTAASSITPANKQAVVAMIPSVMAYLCVGSDCTSAVHQAAPQMCSALQLQNKTCQLVPYGISGCS